MKVPTKTEAAVARFREVHGERFDYSQVDYVAKNLPIRIICREHGKFLQRPDTHQRASIGCEGCRRDGFQRRFVDEIRALHGDRFDYRQIEYRGVEEPITLICRHGPFEVWSNNARRAGFIGCAFCVGAVRRASQATKIVSRFRAVHGNRYGYDDFVYVEMHTKGRIICPKHGGFEMSPANHLQRHGCPSCTNNAASLEENEWIAELEASLGTVAARSVPLGGRAGRLDAVFDGVAIEYDGFYWHSLPGSLAKDERKTAIANRRGYSVIRLRSIGALRNVKLPPVAGAINIWVPPVPSRGCVDEVVSAVHSYHASRE